MILYFAGVVTSGRQERFLCGEAGINWRLLSFADIDSWAKEAFLYWTGPEAPQSFFLDSGAFGALTRGATIDIVRYSEYVEEHLEQVTPYACLDVIGDWRGSAHNYDVMRARGLNPLPTFHMGSPDHELRRLLQQTDYLALGGVVGASRDTMQPWLDKCWRTVKEFWPVKLHIFGVMAQWCLERYPWYSADSSSALVGAGMGRVNTWEHAKISAMPWSEYGQKFYDGYVMDHVSVLQAKGGSAHWGRMHTNILVQKQLQRHVTDLWALRGITWPNSLSASQEVVSPG